MYQLVWMRELRLVFGASSSASSAMIAIFIAGLGAAGLVFGLRAERSAKPLALYAWMECGVTAASAFTPWLLDAARAAYVWSGGSLALGAVGSTCLRLVLTSIVLGPATCLMGGTLPGDGRPRTDPAVVRRSSAQRKSVDRSASIP